MNISEAVEAFARDGTGKKIGYTRVRQLVRQGRIPGYRSESGAWVITEAKVLPKVKEAANDE